MGRPESYRLARTAPCVCTKRTSYSEPARFSGFRRGGGRPVVPGDAVARPARRPPQRRGGQAPAAPDSGARPVPVRCPASRTEERHRSAGSSRCGAGDPFAPPDLVTTRDPRDASLDGRPEMTERLTPNPATPNPATPRPKMFDQLMPFLVLGGVLLAWFTLNKWVLPSFGVST